ncbi:CRISP/Allergen/PR-1-like Protein [Tribolium castaneum]|uniref:CRISP/Allergen/PR-1-like Protein n=1 Tax=Tribolium castaneum TaxID=7070 RepID=D6WC10_TRICA|nr:PREDICTED: venom allergen 5 [Tribolium castaneum]EEZ99141.1 CRISP/Allergen/PR-1-like Protein [Tribolium castaneum]|eukprot:XP_008199481.1 PREDICTED: venom allergen 5 [Tribolium castaneum]
MFQLVVFITVCLIVVHGATEFDPKKTDYCKITCGKNVHPSCNCTRSGNRQEFNLKQSNEFRKLILELHNEARDKIASGNETRYDLTSASNMMAVSYSLELEYFARCFMRNKFVGERDKENCVVMSNGRKVGQNLYGTVGNQSNVSWVEEAFEEWMDEMQNIQMDTINNFTMPVEGQANFDQFTQLMWSTVNEVGCARIYTADTKKNKYVEPYESAILCNYGITILKDQNLAPNTLGQPVYKRGKPCSECPENLKCNKRYHALCGEIAPVPTSAPYALDSSKAMTSKKFKSLTLLVVTIFVSFLL